MLLHGKAIKRLLFVYYCFITESDSFRFMMPAELDIFSYYQIENFISRFQLTEKIYSFIDCVGN